MEKNLIGIDPSLRATGIATYSESEYDVIRIETSRKKVKCPICGKKLGDPNHPAHIKSKKHQKAMEQLPKGEKKPPSYFAPTINCTTRIMNIARKINDICSERNIEYGIIEGLAYSRGGRSTFDLGGLSHYIRGILFQNNIEFIVIPPSTLKIYWCDKGNASKEEMIEETKKRGIEIPFNYDDNCVDAFAAMMFLVDFLNMDLDNDYLGKVETSWERDADHHLPF